jgi:hypothetical protein
MKPFSRLPKLPQSFCIVLTAAVFAAAVLGYAAAPLTSAARELQMAPTAFLSLMFFSVGLIALIMVTLMRYLPKRLDPKYYLPILLTCTVLLRLVWALLCRHELASDFLRYSELARHYIDTGEIKWMRYTSVFPHTWGYTLALSFIYRFFGSSAAAAVGFNLLLCAVIVFLIYNIGKKLFDKETGFRAGLLWTCLPSSIFFVSITGSEMLHLSLFLLAVDCILMTGRSAGFKKRLLWGGLTGAAAGLSTLVRPLGPVLLIAAALTVLLVFAMPLRHKLASLLAVTVSYFLITSLYFGLYLTPLLHKSPDIGSLDEYGNTIVRQYADTRPATGNAGWNLFVGLNSAVSGAWNAEDQAVFNRYYYDEALTASEVHSRIADLAKTRAAAVFRSGEAVSLAARKFISIWSRDDWVADWTAQHAAPSVLSAGALQPALRWLCNAFYLALLICAFLALFRIRTLPAHPVLLILLILLGLWALHLLVENNARYHYPLNAFLCIIASQFHGKQVRQ